MSPPDTHKFTVFTREKRMTQFQPLTEQGQVEGGGGMPWVVLQARRPPRRGMTERSEPSSGREEGREGGGDGGVGGG